MTERRVPIGAYGVVGDTRTAALVAPDGSIDWCGLPRFDAPPVFGRLVGGEAAGCFELGPAEPAEVVRRRYLPGTTTLETTWQVADGEVTATDAMVSDVSGRLLPGTVLVRRIACAGRPVRVLTRFAPRFGYGRDRAARSGRRGGALVCERGPLALALTSDAAIEIEPDRAHEWVLYPAHPATFVLTAARNAPLLIVPPAVGVAEVARDERGWQAWSDGVRGDLPYRDVVVHSLLTLQLLTYSPSGAPVAAVTTSLPEEIGGERNWDYRFAWPRDASIGIGAFLLAGKTEEAMAFVSWLLYASRLDRPRLPALFTLDGRRPPAERSLPDWPGYAASPPVRVGNGASKQHQLDGYGWVVDAAWLLTDAGHALYGETWRAIRGFADHVAERWREPDAGIWERRAAPAHHVHSKLMAWLALDRALRIAAHRGERPDGRIARWTRERDALAADIRERGYDSGLGAYTGRYGAADLDAAVLLLPVLEFEPPDSPRLAGTVDAIRRGLSAGGPLLYRYRNDDGLGGREGAFLPCSFWLAQALARLGRTDEARETFESLVALGGPLGLYAEEMDPATGEHLGNFPQALTHAALVQAALAMVETG